MKKLNFKLFLTLNLLFLFFGCSSSDDLQVNYVYQYEKILFAKGSNGMNNREEINQDLLNFKVKITSSIELSDKLTFDELGVLIKDSKANIEVEYFINDESIIATSIKEGADLNSLAVSSRICGNCVRDQNGNILDSFSCSTQGVKQCSFAVYQNWSKLKIAYESLTGGAQEVVVDCIARNCGGW
ncbi:hypothetical protein NAT47_09395 [Flavobacterium sp. HXWNR69]|jgi:hypothetical protein|uniref:Lipoprotein n=1 Tax=Flavobacterium fragile TaxID=2949085 RepID=A0ABT0TI48_9FLAO|nr:hypothetical protein [Flavobacterium sp. HXWNR69]MCL9770633.1 hypothetical protein [Flavobacterium sp. HXWNR69]